MVEHHSCPRLNAIVKSIAGLVAVCITLASCSGAASGSAAAGKSADLTVTASSVSNDSPVAEATFTLNVTVRNVGDQAASATTLRYFRSQDATIKVADTEVGKVAVAELAAAGTARAPVELTAPVTPGTYYYGACVDAVPGESDTTNNCSISVAVEVAATQGDLPSAPTSFRRACLSPTSACRSFYLRWSPPTQGLPLLRYELSFTGFWDIRELDDLHITDEEGDVGLLILAAQFVNGTFTARVRAVNEQGTGPEARLTYSIPPEAVQEAVPPTQVTNLSASSCPSCDRVRLFWNPPETGQPITRYEVWASNHPQWQATAKDWDGNPFAAFTYKDDDWDEGTYTYKVRATNRHGTGPEASVSIERTR